MRWLFRNAHVSVWLHVAPSHCGLGGVLRNIWSAPCSGTRSDSLNWSLEINKSRFWRNYRLFCFIARRFAVDGWSFLSWKMPHATWNSDIFPPRPFKFFSGWISNTLLRRLFLNCRGLNANASTPTNANVYHVLHPSLQHTRAAAFVLSRDRATAEEPVFSLVGVPDGMSHKFVYM